MWSARAIASKSENRSTRPSAARTGRIFSIAPGSGFLDVLAQALSNGDVIPDFVPASDPLLLADATIYVPSRRSARELANAFVGCAKQEALVLPSIRILGDVDDEEFGLESPEDLISGPCLPIDPMTRTVRLAGLVAKWIETLDAAQRELFQDESIRIPSSRADAFWLADALAGLLSQLRLEEKEWAEIGKIVPEDHAQWWSLSASFLSIVMTAWPEMLAEDGLIDPADHRAAMLDARAAELTSKGSQGPVVVAGSTGSVPSTRRLLEAVSRLPQGAIVLPGLDPHLGEAEWAQLVSTSPIDEPALETHPQYGLARLLAGLGVDRDNVVQLGEARARSAARNRIVSMALSSSATAGNWRQMVAETKENDFSDAIEDLTIVEAANQRQEAMVIALSMREVIETPGETAALVTPDRNLAKRVAGELWRFGLEVDDSGGTPLSSTSAGHFLLNLCKLVFEPADAITQSAFLQAPQCRLGAEPLQAREFAVHYELAALRGSASAPSIGSMAQRLRDRQQGLAQEKHAHPAVKRINEAAWLAAIGHVEKLETGLSELAQFNIAGEPVPVQDIAAELAAAARAIATDADGNTVLSEGPDGRELSRFLDEISTAGGTMLLEQADVVPVFSALLETRTVRPDHARNPRLHIYGPLEARLLDHDRIILGSLNEGTWPQTGRNDPFLNRLMRHELGLPSPERRTGLAAHDFQQLAGSSDVILTRSMRVDGAPTVCSRWIQRLDALIGKTRSDLLRTRGERWLQRARLVDKPTSADPRAPRPNPTPPVEKRPRRLSVSDVETWIRDPYALYAKHVLRLKPLPELVRASDAATKGTLYHEILQDYVAERDPSAERADQIALIRSIAETRIEAESLPAHTSAVWQWRFREIAEKFVDWERKYLSEHAIAETRCEVNGKVYFCGGKYLVTARADRIDLTQDGDALVVDYKTGTNPSVSQARVLLSPQLPLEGAIAVNGEFEGLEISSLSELAYLRLRRGDEFKFESLEDKKYRADGLAKEVAARTEDRFRKYEEPSQGYLSRAKPLKQSEVNGDYDHLARTREWSLGRADGDENG